MDDGRLGDAVHLAQGGGSAVDVMNDREDKVGEYGWGTGIQVEDDAEEDVPDNVLVDQWSCNSVDDIDEDVEQQHRRASIADAYEPMANFGQTGIPNIPILLLALWERAQRECLSSCAIRTCWDDTDMDQG